MRALADLGRAALPELLEDLIGELKLVGGKERGLRAAAGLNPPLLPSEVVSPDLLAIAVPPHLAQDGEDALGGGSEGELLIAVAGDRMAEPPVGREVAVEEELVQLGRREP